MSKEAVFTMKLEPELRTAFMAAAAAEDRPASQIVRELMREYIVQRAQSSDYDDYLQRKVGAGRASMRAGQGLPNAEIEAEFATRRDKVLASQA